MQTESFQTRQTCVINEYAKMMAGLQFSGKVDEFGEGVFMMSSGAVEKCNSEQAVPPPSGVFTLNAASYSSHNRKSGVPDRCIRFTA